MTQRVTSAMLLSAGLGTRMRPLTNDRTKPMLELGGKTMLDHALDKCVAAGVIRAVINLHYKGEVIQEHLKTRKDIAIIFSPEPTILDSGGGVKQALPHLGDGPFFCINTDLVFTDVAVPGLQQLANAWDDARTDIVMLMKETDKAHGFGDVAGDYHMSDVVNRVGHVLGRTKAPPKPYVFLGAMLMHPRVYAGIAETVFSNRVVFDAAEAAGRLYGVVHDGEVYHSGTPEDLARNNQLFAG